MYRYYISVTVTDKFFFWTNTPPDNKEKIVDEVFECFNIVITVNNIEEEGEVSLPVGVGTIMPSAMNLEITDEIRSTTAFRPESVNTPTSEDNIPVLFETGDQDETDQVPIPG